MAITPGAGSQNEPNFQALGLRSPMEVIDILGMLEIDGDPVIKNDKSFLDPQLKAQEVMTYFKDNLGIQPNELPYIASTIKNEMKKGILL